MNLKWGIILTNELLWGIIEAENFICFLIIMKKFLVWISVLMLLGHHGLPIVLAVDDFLVQDFVSEEITEDLSEEIPVN